MTRRDRRRIENEKKVWDRRRRAAEANPRLAAELQYDIARRECERIRDDEDQARQYSALALAIEEFNRRFDHVPGLT